MAARGRPKAEFVLSTEERLALERLANRRNSAQALAMRARVVMACAKGDTNSAVAEKLRVSQAMVGQWRRRFVERRLDGLFDEPSAGSPEDDHRRPGRSGARPRADVRPRPPLPTC